MAKQKKIQVRKSAKKPAAVKKSVSPKKTVKKTAVAFPKASKVVKKPAAKPAPKPLPKKKVAPKAVVKSAPKGSKKGTPKKAPKKPAKKILKKAPAKVAPKAPAKVAAKAVKKTVVKVTSKATPKAASKKAPAKVAPKMVPPKFASPKATPPKPVSRPRAYSAKELESFRAQLQQQLELVHGNLQALSADNLKRSPVEANGDISSHSTHMADHGTDNFDRELALNLASGRQESIYDIEDAIHRIDEGTYGVCESCGGPIEHPRLKALPFAKKCVACQNASERGRTRYRPFGGTLAMQQYNAPDESAHGDMQE